MKENLTTILESGDIRQLLFRYSGPAIVAMIAASLYNLTDSIFIGKGVHHLALSGLTVTFPFMNLMAAFGTLVAIGASTVLSLKLGQKDYSAANRVFGNVLILNIIIGVVLTLALLPFLDPILYFFGASDNFIEYARDYMKVILIGNVITHAYFGMNALLRSSGFPNMSMYITLLSVAINCAITPVFIFVFGWGMKGSAWATVLSQFISLVVQMVHLSNKKHIIHFQKGIYRLRRKLVFNIFSIGLSPFLVNACSCLIIILITRGLRQHGGDLGAYGIVNRISFLFVMVIAGLNQGMQPIAGYNYGAGKFPRVKKVTKLAIMYAVAISSAGFLVCELFPDAIISLFTSHHDLIKEAKLGLRIVFIVFPTVGFQMVASNFFMSIGKSQKAIFLSLTRQVLFLIPLLIILPQIYGIWGVWVSIPVSDFISFIVTLILFFSYLRKN